MRRVLWTDHARQNARDREIEVDGVLAVLAAPITVTPDPLYVEWRRAFGRVEAFGNRVLRVVYEVEGETIVIVTVTWDRDAGRRI